LLYFSGTKVSIFFKYWLLKILKMNFIDEMYILIYINL
jgi:hypothetical protein